MVSTGNIGDFCTMRISSVLQGLNPSSLGCCHRQLVNTGDIGDLCIMRILCVSQGWSLPPLVVTVENTRDIGDLCIMRMSSVSQGSSPSSIGC